MKKITLGLLALAPLALASCNIFNTPESKNLDGTVVEGKITTDGAGKMTLTTSAWAGGAGQVILKGLVSGGSSEEVARTPLAADGKFNLAELPVLADKYLSNVTVGQSANCTSDLVVSDKTARGNSIQLSVDADKDGAISVYVDNNIYKQTSPIYFDKATAIKGQIKCPPIGGITTINYDANMKAGWNTLQIILEGNSITITNGDSYRGQKWTLIDNTAAPAAMKMQNLFSQR